MVNNQRLDRVFAGLADPTRRAILARLSKGEKSIGELAAGFDMSLPAVSKHVHVLQRAGLARIRRDGRRRRTTLVAGPLRDAASWIERYRQFWDFQLDQLAAYLDETGSERSRSDDDSAGPPQHNETGAWQPPPSSKAKGSSSGGRSPRRRSASSKRGRGRKS